MTSSRLVFSEDLSASVATCTSVVRVKNLRSIIAGPHDAWGRSSRPQPFTISASVGFQSSFTSSSSTDHLSEDTVHYGLLAKAILAILNRIAQEPKDRSLRDVLDTMWIDLSGFDTFGVPQQPVGGQPFLNVATISSLEIVADLPKASLLGDGISIATAASFQCIDGVVVVSARTQSLKLRELRVPTLIGVNSNERLAKQVVIANLEIEGLDDTGDTFCLLEDVLVKELSQSYFETLEALSMLLAKRITDHLKKTHVAVPNGWQLNISLEKPIAIPLADASCVELRMKTQSLSD